MASQSVNLGVEPSSGAHGQIFFTVWHLRSCFCGAPSLTRGRVCLLYMLLALASAVFLGSESLGTRDHILLSQIRDFPFRRLLRLAGSRWRYSTGIWIKILFLTTRILGWAHVPLVRQKLNGMPNNRFLNTDILFRSYVKIFLHTHLLSIWYFARLIRPWQRKRYVPPKRRLIFSGPHSVISQKTVLWHDAWKSSNCSMKVPAEMKAPSNRGAVFSGQHHSRCYATTR
jgi:hypothetical protein